MVTEVMSPGQGEKEGQKKERKKEKRVFLSPACHGHAGL